MYCIDTQFLISMGTAEFLCAFWSLLQRSLLITADTIKFIIVPDAYRKHHISVVPEASGAISGGDTKCSLTSWCND